MNIYTSLVAVVILLCIIAEKFSGRFGMPALIFFMFLGMLFGSDGIMKIPFDDFKMAENVCSIASLNLAPNELITMIIRENENLIPDGKTLIHENDIVVMYK